jgi:hypothetical protein
MSYISNQLLYQLFIYTATDGATVVLSTAANLGES